MSKTSILIIVILITLIGWIGYEFFSNLKASVQCHAFVTLNEATETETLESTDAIHINDMPPATIPPPIRKAKHHDVRSINQSPQ